MLKKVVGSVVTNAQNVFVERTQIMDASVMANRLSIFGRKGRREWFASLILERRIIALIGNFLWK